MQLDNAELVKSEHLKPVLLKSDSFEIPPIYWSKPVRKPQKGK